MLFDLVHLRFCGTNCQWSFTCKSIPMNIFEPYCNSLSISLKSLSLSLSLDISVENKWNNSDRQQLFELFETPVQMSIISFDYRYHRT